VSPAPSSLDLAALVPLPPSPPPPPVIAPAANFPWAGYRLSPAGFDTSHQFIDVLRRCPAPPRFPLAANSCVWVALSDVFNVDYTLLWAVWMAFAPNPADYIDGSTEIADLAGILAFFRVGGAAYPCELDGGRPSANPDTVPITDRPAEPFWPSAVFSVWNPIPGGDWHMENRPPFITDTVNPIPPNPRTLLSLGSRFVGLNECLHILSYPTRGFHQVYDAFLGVTANPAMMGLAATLPPAMNAALPQPRRVPAPVQIPQFGVTPQQVSLMVDANALRRARAAESMAFLPQAVEISEVEKTQYISHFKHMCKKASGRDVDATLLHGAPGTGKTYALAQIITTQIANGRAPNDIQILCPNEVLRANLERDLCMMVPQLVSENFWDFRKAIRGVTGLVIFDDVGQMWPGFAEAILACYSVDEAIFTFDACQSTRAWPKGTHAASFTESPIKWLLPYSHHYATQMRRSSIENAELMGLPTGSNIHASCYFVAQFPHDIPVLAASPRFVENLRNAEIQASSFSDVQGLTFDGDIGIDLGGMTAEMSDSLMFVALTRCRGNIWLKLPATPSGGTSVLERSFGASRILSAMLAVACRHQTAVINTITDVDRLVASAVQSHMAHKLGPTLSALLGLNAQLPRVAGIKFSPEAARIKWAHSDISTQHITTAMTYSTTRGSGDRVGVSMLDPNLRGRTRREQVQDILRHHYEVNNETIIVKPVHRVEAPPLPVTINPDPALNHEEVGVDAELAEAYVPKAESYTSVFYPDGPTELQHHKRSDLAQVERSESERTPNRHDDPRLTHYDKVRLSQLQRAFKMLFPTFDTTFDEEELLMCREECMGSWINGKTQKQIVRAATRWFGEHPFKRASIFLKSQWVKKLEAKNLPAKKGQIVTEFPMGKTVRDAPYALYLEKKIIAAKAPNLLFLTRMGISEVNDWYQHHWDPDETTTSIDFTGWDTGVDRVFLAFHCWLFRLAGFPEDYIETYFDEMVNTKTPRGSLPIMQASGNRYTLLLNSVGNACLIGSMLEITPETPIGVCGDDSIICGNPRNRRGFRPKAWRMAPKKVVRPSQQFCGLVFGTGSIGFDHDSFLHRAKTALRRGVNNADFWNSMDFAIHFAAPAEFSDVLQHAVDICNDARRIFSLPDSIFLTHKPIIKFVNV